MSLFFSVTRRLRGGRFDQLLRFAQQLLSAKRLGQEGIPACFQILEKLIVGART